MRRPNPRATTRSTTPRRRSRVCSSSHSSRRTRRRREEIVLDLDATEDPLHGHQEGRFFHGYGACPPAAQRANRGDCYCYLPLYVFCGRHLHAARLRRSNIAWPPNGVGAPLPNRAAKPPVPWPRSRGSWIQTRARWPRVKILLRATPALPGTSS